VPAVLHHKVVSALPGTLDANSIYYVRVGTGFDLYVTNDSGTIVAYPINSSGGGSGVVTVDVDFGTAAKRVAMATIADGSVTTTSVITASQSGAVAAGRTADEVEWTQLTVSAACRTNGFVTLVAACPPGETAVGVYKAHYSVATP
jgi:hypothetical protein